MDLINKKVIHGTFGKGKVVSCNEDHIKVDFESGAKKFVFPDVFGKYMTLSDETAAQVVDKKLQKKEEEEQAILEIKREEAMERERQNILQQGSQSMPRRDHPELQSVFWCKPEDVDKIFTEWQVFVGTFKSGTRKGEPKRLARMNRNSACLITQRQSDIPEEERRILGLFMAPDNFNGKAHETGYVEAHPEYRLRLSEKESEKMLFWNYYKNKRFPERMTWKSGKQRYFDNIWLAQILQDIIALKKDPEEKKEAELFLDYFAKNNNINLQQLPKPDGALVQEEA